MAGLIQRLPAEVRALADVRQGEAAWRRADLPRVADAARALGLAATGGQVQLRLPSVTHELYWQDYDPGERSPGETWAAYADRSWKELLFLTGTLPPDMVMIDGARRLWPWLKLTDAAAAEAMWFVVYLAAEA
ncbi:MAG TPA: hypothetical protein VIJ94_12230 [Caulobacteraceae bacterium]